MTPQKRIFNNMYRSEKPSKNDIYHLRFLKDCGKEIPETCMYSAMTPGKESDRYQLNKKIGVQFQATSIQELMRVKEAINLFSSFYDTHHDLMEIIEQLHLKDKLNSYFKDLSGGWKQRVTLALSVLHQPEIVFLDEPIMGLDPQARRDL